MANPVSKNQNVPKLDSPIARTTNNGQPVTITTGWYQLFIYLWRLAGKGTADPNNTVTLAQTEPPSALLDVFDGEGNRIGSVALGP